MRLVERVRLKRFVISSAQLSGSGVAEGRGGGTGRRGICLEPSMANVRSVDCLMGEAVQAADEKGARSESKGSWEL